MYACIMYHVSCYTMYHAPCTLYHVSCMHVKGGGACVCMHVRGGGEGGVCMRMHVWGRGGGRGRCVYACEGGGRGARCVRACVRACVRVCVCVCVCMRAGEGREGQVFVCVGGGNAPLSLKTHGHMVTMHPLYSPLPHPVLPHHALSHYSQPSRAKPRPP